jgi:hypothetical protein
MKPFLKISGLILVSLISMIILTEVALRLTCKKLIRCSPHMYQTDTLTGYRYQPNAKWTFVNIAIKNACYSNSHGFPGDEFSLKKKEGVYRIIIVGDSNDTGFNTDGPLNYVKLLNKYFQTNNIRVEVINCAIDGKDRGIRNLKLIVKELVNYEPDLILLSKPFPLTDRLRYRTTYKNIQINCLYLNEMDSAKLYVDKELSHKTFVIHLFDWSYIFRYVCKYYFDNKDDKTKKLAQFIGKSNIKDIYRIRAYARSEMYWLWEKKTEKQLEIKQYSEDKSLQFLKKVNNALSKKNVKLILFDTYENKNSGHLRKLFNPNGINYLPLNIPPKKEYDFGKLDEHSTQKGHKAIADAFYSVLIDSIIPKEYIAQMHK